LIVNLLLLVSA